MSPAAAAPDAVPGPDSALARIVGAFVFPATSFRAIARRPTWLVPLVIWTALSFLVSELVLSRSDWRTVIVESAAHRDQKLTDAQMEEAVERTKKFGWVFDVFAVVVPTLLVGGTAGTLWLACQAFGWEIRFPQAFGVTAHAFLPSIAGAAVVLGLLWGRQTVDPQSLGDLLHTSPAFLVSPRDARVTHSLLSSLDILSFWTMGLLVVGLSTAARAPRGRMAALVVGLWGLYVLGKTGIVALFS
jgi:hypothetical protein